MDAAAATLADGTLQHFVFSSLPSPEAVSGGRVRGLDHYEGKVDVVRYLRSLKPAKAGEKSLGDVTTLVWVAYYMENFARWDLNAYLRPRKVWIYMPAPAHPALAAQDFSRTAASPEWPLCHKMAK